MLVQLRGFCIVPTHSHPPIRTDLVCAICAEGWGAILHIPTNINDDSGEPGAIDTISVVKKTAISETQTSHIPVSYIKKNLSVAL
jgi:hypothetical protein